MFISCDKCGYDSGDHESHEALHRKVKQDGGRVVKTDRGYIIKCPKGHGGRDVHQD